jgi:hypothetical protein
MASHSQETARDSLSDRTMVVPTIMTPDLAVQRDQTGGQETAEVPAMASVLGLQVEAAPHARPAAPDGPNAPRDAPAASPSAVARRPRAFPRVTAESAVRVALGLVLLVLAVPTLTLIARSVFGDRMNPAGVVGGLLVLAGLSLLAAGAAPLVLARTASSARRESGDVDRASVPSGTTVLVGAGVVLLFCAAIAVI